MIAALLLTAQTAPAAAAPAPQSWSILARGEQQCTEKPDERGNIIVCVARQGPRLPLPDERPPPDHPMPSNPNVDGAGALAIEAPPCSAVQRGCTVGVGPPPALVHAAIDAGEGRHRRDQARFSRQAGQVETDTDPARLTRRGQRPAAIGCPTTHGPCTRRRGDDAITQEARAPCFPLPP